MRAKPPLLEMFCHRQDPPFLVEGGAVRATGQGGHGKGQPSIRLALAASAELGGLVKDKAWLPQPRGAPLAQ